MVGGSLGGMKISAKLVNEFALGIFIARDERYFCIAGYINTRTTSVYIYVETGNGHS